MLVYRITRRKYANDITGEGARLFGGRWNNKLVNCLYTSESRALAILEYTANISIDDIPRALCIVTFEIDDKVSFEAKESTLPGNWKSLFVPKETQDFGSNLLLNPAIQVIRIPSTIVPDEFNYLISPLHYKGKLKIHSIKDFVYDIRLKVV